MSLTDGSGPLVRCLAIVALTAVLGGGAVAASTWAADPVEIPRGVVTVDGQETAVYGSFAYHRYMDDAEGEVRGLVHGVQRIDGGTILYYSIGMREDSSGSFTGMGAFPDSSDPYQITMATDITLVDSVGLAAYRPVFDDTTTFTSRRGDLDSDLGTLRVGWAVFPELPADVESVQVLMPWGTAVSDVPVGDGPLLPVSDEPAPLLGEGWPAAPSAADLAGVDPEPVTFTLTRRTGDVAGTATVEETPEQVAVTLDANVLFASGSAELSAAAQDVLASVGADVRSRGTGEVVVTGHTDSDGSDESNQTLSEQRAAAVLALLQPSAGQDVTFRAVGEGESSPVAGNDTDAGKQANRRVTVVYGVKGDS